MSCARPRCSVCSKAWIAFRRPDRFRQFVLACEADARGRKGLEDRDYPQGARLREAYERVAGRQARCEARAGLEGSAIAERIAPSANRSLERQRLALT
jgi:tRNA nucleotidyltransferase (CCA-adding enzyme)